MSEDTTGAPEPQASSGGATHAHDRYFRAGLQGRAEQEALVGALFPELMPLLDGEGFEAVDGTFVDEELRQRQTDVVLRTRLAGRDVLVYVLVEHQRTVDPLMAVRMMRYQARIWDRHLARHPGSTRVPAILPAVIYQGARAWTAPTDVRDVLDLDPSTAAAMEKYLPQLRYRLDDLTRVDVATLRARVSTAPLRLMLLLLMQAPGNPQVVELLESMVEDLTMVAAGPNGSRHMEAAFTYIVSVTDVPTGRLRPVASRLGPAVLEALMTTADVLRAEGRARGQAEGRARGQAEGQAVLLLRQLTVKFGPLSDSVEAQVHTATGAQLGAWAERVLTAATLDDVWG